MIEELSYPFEDLRGTHAATCDRVVLVYIWVTWAVEKCAKNLFQAFKKLRNPQNFVVAFFLTHPVHILAPVKTELSNVLEWWGDKCAPLLILWN